MKSGLFTGQGFAAPQQFGVDLGQFLQPFPVLLVGGDAVGGGLLLDGSLQEEFQDVARAQVGQEVEEGSMALALAADAVGFATGGEALDVGGAEQVRGGSHLPQQEGAALAQGQGRGATELVYLSHFKG